MQVNLLISAWEVSGFWSWALLWNTEWIYLLVGSQMSRNSQVMGWCIPLKYSRTETSKLQSKVMFRIFFSPLELGSHRHGFGPRGHLPQAHSTEGFVGLGQWNVFSWAVCYITALCIAQLLLLIKISLIPYSQSCLALNSRHHLWLCVAN